MEKLVRESVDEDGEIKENNEEEMERGDEQVEERPERVAEVDSQF